jgi:hypothetical protein
MGKIRGAIAIALLFALFSPNTTARADDSNPSTSEIDNFASLRIAPASKQGFAMSNQNILNASTGSFTIEGWINPSESMTSASGIIFLKQDSVALLIDNANLGVRLNGGAWSNFSTSVSVRINEWQHIAMVKSTTNLYLYLNGSLVYQNASVVANISSNTKYVGIGGDGWNGTSTLTSPQTSLFSGGIDEVRIWNSARSLSDIRSSMNRKLSGSTAGLLANWDFNGTGSSTTIFDRTSNGYNLTIYGEPSFPDIKTVINSGGFSTITFPRAYLNAVGGFRIPMGVSSVSALIVGGGGGGGFDGGGGGGGGGVYQNSNITVTPETTYAIEVGGGGPAINGYVGGTFCGGTHSGSVVGCSSASGVASKFGILTASGGGGGGGIENNGDADSDASANVRGGGGGAGAQNLNAGAPTPGAGAFSGGTSTNASNNGGGGGGSSAASGGASTSVVAGNGASGVAATLNATIYGSGGAGGTFSSSTVATGGSGAANGGTNGVAPTKPLANRGGGGGGGGNGQNSTSGVANSFGTSGAAGVVIVRYALTGFSNVSFTSSPVYREASTISAATNVASRVTFFVNNKRIPNCIKKATVNLVATCSWRPATRGATIISVEIAPVDSNYSLVVQRSNPVTVAKRISRR